jgi:hypothetical protein
MGGTVRWWIILVLLPLSVGTAIPDARSGEPGPPSFRGGNPEWPPGEKLTLSLRIARAKKDGKRITRYKSLARQRKRIARRPPGGMAGPPPTGNVVTGRHPPGGR